MPDADETVWGVEGESPPQAEQFPGYRIVRQLSRGGQGVVFQAIQLSTKRKVAIKVSHDAHAFAGEMKRFEREIELVAQLRHPNIISVFDSGRTSDGRPFFVMDYVRGEPLGAYVRSKNLSRDDALRLLIAICDACHYAHQRGIVHRDLKPSNILVDEQGIPKVLDFGLAKRLSASDATLVTMSNQALGTLPYMSPEQARGSSGQIDVRTDIYSMGVVLYEQLTGHFPYAVRGPLAQVIQNILSAPPAPMVRKPKSTVSAAADAGGEPTTSFTVDKTLSTIVLRALEKDPDFRYQSMRDLAQDLRHYLSGEPLTVDHSLVQSLRRSLRKYRRRLIVGAAATCLVLAAGTAFTIYTLNEQRARAQRAAETQRQAAEEAARKLQAARAAVDEATSWINLGGLPELARAEQHLNMAIGLDPYNEEAYIQRGRLCAMRGLEAPADRKEEAVQEALKNFHIAHLVSGGNPLNEEVPEGAPDLSKLPEQRKTRSTRGIRAGLDLLAFLSRTAEAEKWLAALAERADGDVSSSDFVLPPIYSERRDPLLKSKLPQETPAQANLDPDQSQTLVIGVVRMPTTHLLSPQAQESPFPALTTESLFVMLEDGSCVRSPALTRDAQFADGVWTVKLNPAARWHDGRRVTAGDAVFTWTERRRDAGQSPSLIEAILAPDDETVVIKLMPDSPPEPWEAMFPLVPAHWFSERSAEYPDRATLLEEFSKNPLGCGPFSSRKSDSEIVLTRVADYAGPPVFVAGFTIRLYPSREEALAALSRGEIDALDLSAVSFGWYVNGESYSKIFKVRHDRSLYEFICWNCRDRRFADPRVRQALTRSLQLDTVRATCLGNLYAPFRSLFDPARYGEIATRYSFDPDEADRLFNEAGWRRGLSGIREKDGEPLAFELAVQADAFSLSVAGIFQRQFAAAGVKMTVKPVNSVYGALESRDFDAAYSGVETNFHPSLDRVRYHSAGLKNHGGYSNKFLDEAFSLAGPKREAADTRHFYQNAQELIYRDQPYTFLWTRPSLWAFSNRMHGIRFTRFGPFRFYPGPRAWWVPADRAQNQ